MTDPARVTPSEMERTIRELVAARGPGKTICPSEAARALAGDDPEAWSRLMPLARRSAVAMMKRREVVIRRKGRPVDPDDFRGIYRIGPTEEVGEGPGKSASDLPDSR